MDASDIRQASKLRRIATVRGFCVDPNAYEALVRRREARIADDARIPGAGFKHASGTAAFGVLPD